ncbi:hypothetical protein WJX84_004860 [Apatococcus fuscideae]|uniref:Uncharacterized protein n=1 Tax=Apatococcus fuscideae TaxID=2026836 RepID=A0AAW1T0D0_9CHLO
MQTRCILGPCGIHAPTRRGLQLASAHHLGSPVFLYQTACCRLHTAPSLQWRSSGQRSRLIVNSKLSLYTRLTGNDEDEARDDFKEESRKYRRTVFTFSRWASHRSTSRYYRHILGLFTSRIVFGLASPLLVITVISFMVASYESLREAGILPGSLPGVTFSVTGELFNLSSFALSLLLVFRTNASYDRWLEARLIWGGIINRSRDLVRQGLTWFKPEEAELLELLRRWTVAFSRSAMCHLREDADLETHLQNVLKPEELELLLRAEHRPNCVLHMLGEIVRQASCLTLRFTAWMRLWAIVPGCAILAFLLLGIEEIGVSIEEPMSILPLENFCARAEENISELIFQSTDVKAMAANWSPGRASDSQDPNSDSNGNGRSSPSYLANNQKSKEVITSIGKRNSIRGWPPSGPLSQ